MFVLVHDKHWKNLFRCTRFRFGPLNSTQIVPRLQFVADEEKVNMTEDGKKALITLAQGDMRKVRMIMIKMSMI